MRTTQGLQASLTAETALSHPWRAPAASSSSPAPADIPAGPGPRQAPRRRRRRSRSGCRHSKDLEILVEDLVDLPPWIWEILEPARAPG